MPPKAKFSREEIVQAGLSLVRAQGMQGLTARALGAALTVFRSMEEVAQAVIESANVVYQRYIKAEMAKGVYPPYKASGMGYIHFAKEERELFRLLFMRDRTHEPIEENREEIRPLLEILQQQMGVSEDLAYLFHLEM